MRNCPKAFLLNFPCGATRILSSPKWKGHPIYSKPFWRLTYRKYLYRRTLLLPLKSILKIFQIYSSLISRKEEKIAFGADHLFLEKENTSTGGLNAHHHTGVCFWTSWSRCLGTIQQHSTCKFTLTFCLSSPQSLISHSLFFSFHFPWTLPTTNSLI